MEDPRTAQGVEHLQSAARELLKAARSFLDVVEEVVEDPERLTGAAAGLSDLVAGFTRRRQPWEDAAWVDEDVRSTDWDETDSWTGSVPADDAPLDESADEQAAELAHDELWGPDEADERPPAPVVPTPRRDAAGRRRAAAPSRVRRITVE
jgi:hypothetical protein